MELFFELHDNEGVCHNEFQSKFTVKTSLDQLKEKIRSKFHIDSEDQHLLSVNGKKINGLGSSTLLEIGLKNGDKIFVKHSMVANWGEFKANFELAEKALQSKQMSMIEEAVDQALDHLKPLVKAKFLVVYPSFCGAYRRFKTEFSRFMDQEFKYIEFAAHDYFSKFFNDNLECPIVNIKCEKKELAGIQGGLICNVTKSGVLVGKYHVKEHMGLANYQNADLRKLCVYKLLELIQIGPKVHFLPNTHYSCFGLYIATEDVSGFRRGNAEGVDVSDVLRAQHDLLRRVLFLKDVHSENYGVDGNGKLSIVDFKVDDHTSTAKVNKYLEGYKSWKGSKELRIRVGKDCFASWNLSNMLSQADAGIAKQKEFFNKHSISYKPSRNYDEYLIQVKNNVTALTMLFE